SVFQVRVGSAASNRTESRNPASFKSCQRRDAAAAGLLSVRPPASRFACESERLVSGGSDHRPPIPPPNAFPVNLLPRRGRFGAGTDHAVNLPNSVTTRSPQRNSSSVTAGHGTWVDRNTLPICRPPSVTQRNGLSNTAQTSAANSSGTAP